MFNLDMINMFHWRSRSDGTESLVAAHRPCMRGAAYLIVDAIAEAKSDAEKRHGRFAANAEGDHVFYVDIPGERDAEGNYIDGCMVRISYAHDPEHPDRLRVDWIEGQGGES